MTIANVRHYVLKYVQFNMRNMYPITEELDLISTTELRGNIPKVTKQLNKKSVIVTSRNKPVGVFMNFEKFKALQALEEEYLDYGLLKIAEKRAANPKAKYITLDELEKKLGL
jgi:prevent-host-death family protein